MTPSALLQFQRAYATGWLVAAPIGPVNLEIIRRSLRRGLLPGWLIGLGATFVDATYLILFSVGFGAVLERAPWLNAILFVLGGALLSWLGADALREAWRYLRLGWQEAHRIEGDPESRWARFTDSLLGHFLLGVAMCAANPMTLAFWSSLALGFAHLSPVGRVTASGAVWLGALSWTLTLTAILAFARRWVGPRLFALVTSAGGICMLSFGLGFLWRGLSGS
jgi:L-lysine exporter family protein LysE/ArgO